MSVNPVEEKSAGGDSSVLKRVSAIFNLISESQPAITVADVEAALQVSSATAYRYLGDLCDIGLLHRVSGRYAPGPKILEFEYLIRKFDPILGAAKDLMSQLSEKTECHVLLSRLYGHRLVNIFYAKAPGLPDIPFIPGRRLPVFHGSQSRIVLSFLDRRKLRKIFDSYPEDPWRAKIGDTWETFVATLNKDRRAGYYISRNELAEDTTGVAAPVFDETGDPIGALTLTFASSAPPWMGEQMIVDVAMQNARIISQRILESTRAEGGTAVGDGG